MKSKYFWPIIIALALAAGAFALFAHAQPPAAKLSEGQKLKFFKAQSEFIQADSAARAADDLQRTKKATFESVLVELTKACGTGYQLGLDQQGDPTCVVKAVEKGITK